MINYNQAHEKMRCHNQEAIKPQKQKHGYSYYRNFQKQTVK